MQKVFFIILLILCFVSSYTQTVYFKDKELQKPLLVSSYSPTHDNCAFAYIPTTFAGHHFTDWLNRDTFRARDIIAIDLVYTDYPKGNPFIKLNRKRIEMLEQHFAGFLRPDIPLQLYRQTKSIKKEDAVHDFHGFVIYFKPLQKNHTVDSSISENSQFLTDSVMLSETATDIKYDSIPFPVFITDSEFIGNLINNDFHPDSIKQIKQAYLHPADSVYQNYIFCYSKSTLEYYRTIKAKNIKIYTKEELKKEEKSLRNLINETKDACDSLLYVTCKVPRYSPVARFYTTDSVVQKTLARNKWQNMFVCADVTGSMAPYIVQLLVWLKLNDGNRALKYFIAFNDGDSTADKKKKIGKTGGIYATASHNYKDVASTVYTGVKNGNGGDAGENDIEALLKGQESCPDCSELVLIADNYAPVKDMKLLHRIKKPVKVILCGADFSINIDYLNIARKTGGSIHTIENDIIHLALMKEGETFEFKGHKYKISGGSFIEIRINPKIM